MAQIFWCGISHGECGGENGNTQCTRAATSHDCSADASASDNVDAADVVVVIVIVLTAVALAAGKGAAN